MRDFAQIRLSIWNDDEFRSLPPESQHLYFVLISHPTLTYVGVGDWRPNRIAKLSDEWTEDGVKAAARELIEKQFILVDDETEEFLVRSFVRNDPLLKQPKLSVSMARAFALVASQALRGVIVFELNRLRGEFPKLAAWSQDEAVAVLGKESVDPHVYPLGKGSDYPKLRGSFTHRFRGSFTPNDGQSLGVHLGDRLGVPYNSNINNQPSTGNIQQEGVETVTTVTGGDGQDFPLPDFSDDEVGAAIADAFPGPKPRASDVGGMAYGTPDDPRCHTHKDLPRDQVPACAGCARAREYFHAQAAERKQSRRAEIDACGVCDEFGFITVGEGHDARVVKCDHTGRRPPVDPPPVFVPQTDAKTRQRAIQAVKRATTSQPDPPF